MKTNVYILEGLDCANCAAKLEQKINSLEGVETASITFATGQLRVTAEDPDQLLDQIIDTAHKMEPDVKIYKKEMECFASLQSFYIEYDSMIEDIFQLPILQFEV